MPRAMHTNPSTFYRAQVISIMYLFEEMARELIELPPWPLNPYSLASPPSLFHGWMVETSNPSATFTWHTDHINATYSVICQCEPSETSIEIYGQGELIYGGVGSFIVLPSASPHRSLRNEGSAWKIAGFFA